MGIADARVRVRPLRARLSVADHRWRGRDIDVLDGAPVGSRIRRSRRVGIEQLTGVRTHAD